MLADTQRKVRVYDPVRAALSNVPINDTSLWPTINSTSNTIVELKAELVQRKMVSSNQFSLTVQQGTHWMDESEIMQWPDNTILCVRVTPIPPASLLHQTFGIGTASLAEREAKKNA